MAFRLQSRTLRPGIGLTPDSTGQGQADDVVFALNSTTPTTIHHWPIGRCAWAFQPQAAQSQYRALSSGGTNHDPACVGVV